MNDQQKNKIREEWIEYTSSGNGTPLSRGECLEWFISKIDELLKEQEPEDIYSKDNEGGIHIQIEEVEENRTKYFDDSLKDAFNSTLIEDLGEDWEKEFDNFEKDTMNWSDADRGECGLDFEVTKDFIRNILSSNTERVKKEIEKTLELHTHDSIPSYTDNEEEGCRLCIINRVKMNIINKIK